MNKAFHKIVVVLALILATLLLLLLMFSLIRVHLDVNVSSNGLIALFLGCFFSFVLVGVLTYLLFLSHQKGFDDQVIDPSSENKKK
tara:strand:+ start:290 stop:547 length:258 start_codon:yes stop_codon:yes gene_type:complete